jgi:hypothetical protein
MSFVEGVRVTTAFAEPTMARTEKPRRDDKTVKMDRALADKAAFVIKQIGPQLGRDSVAEYVTEHLRAVIERDFAKAVKKAGMPPSDA